MPSFALVIANVVNPVLAASVVLEPLVHPKPGDPAWRFWGRAAVGIGGAVLLAEWGKARPVWPGHPTFPSGHETFALASITFLILRNPRWLIPAPPVLVLLAWALVAAHFHQPIDVAGALLTGPPAALLCDALMAPRNASPR